MKILFCVMPAHGHINPTLAAVQELVRRGEDVLYYTTAAFADKVRRAGATVELIDDAFGIPEIERMGDAIGGTISMPRLVEFLVQAVAGNVRRAPELIERAQRDSPDLVVYDPMCLWGHAIAQVLRLPAVTFSSSFAINEHSPLLRQFSSVFKLPSPGLMRGLIQLLWASERLHRRYNIPRFTPASMFAAVEDLNIIPLSRAFQPDADAFDDRFVFIGPSITPRHEPLDLPLDQVGARPLLYISLGTTPVNKQPAFFKTCFEAFADTSWRVVVVSGAAMDQLGPIPPNFIVRSYVPQLELLQRADAFVSHGGMNSTMEALWFGVPLVVVPQMIEQAQTAARMAELGLGVQLDPQTLDAATLRAAVDRVGHDRLVRERLAAMQRAVRAAGGYERAADAIQAHVGQAVAV